MKCWEKFLTPEVEVDDKYNETYLTYQCDINHKAIKVYYGNDEKLNHRYISNIAMAALPVCLSCTRRQQDGHSDNNRLENKGPLCQFYTP